MANQKEFFNRNKPLINRFVRGYLAKNKVGIVHGTKASNVQLPRYLERETRDWDVFVKKPKLRARQVERLLDKRFGGDYFKVKKGATVKLKVHKVVSNINDKGYVDFSIPDRTVPVTAKRGVKYATLKDQYLKAKSNVKDKEKEFRKEKDMDLIRRVKKFEKLRRKKV